MSKSPLHVTISQLLAEILRSRVAPGFLVRQEAPLTLPDSEPEPDLAVVRGQWAEFTKSHPSSAVLVVEIAIASEERDEAKADIYAEAGIPEYWIVRPQERRVDVLRGPTAQGYARRTTMTASEVLACEGLPGLAVRVDEVIPIPA